MTDDHVIVLVIFRPTCAGWKSGLCRYGRLQGFTLCNQVKVHRCQVAGHRLHLRRLPRRLWLAASPGSGTWTSKAGHKFETAHAHPPWTCVYSPPKLTLQTLAPQSGNSQCFSNGKSVGCVAGPGSGGKVCNLFVVVHLMNTVAL